MKPQKPDNNADLFRSKLSQVLNLGHPLVRLSEKMNGGKLEADIDIIYNEGAGQPPFKRRPSPFQQMQRQMARWRIAFDVDG